MKKNDDEIPCEGAYKGVPLHAGQCERRLNAVRADIDHALGLGNDIEALMLFIRDARRAPEARLYGGARLHAMHAEAARARDGTTVDLALVEALVAPARSRNWRSPVHYGSDLDLTPAVPRDPDDAPIVD